MALVLNCSITHGISVYDATYLELAMRLQMPLTTLDRDLQAAARSAGVDVPAIG